MRPVRVLSVLAVAASGLVLTAPSAGATTCVAGVCIGGSVAVRGASSVSVTSDWNTKASRPIYPGQTSRSYFFDADGLYVTAGCDVQGWIYSTKDGSWFRTADRWTATGWHKIGDATNVTVSREC